MHSEWTETSFINNLFTELIAFGGFEVSYIVLLWMFSYLLAVFETKI